MKKFLALSVLSVGIFAFSSGGEVSALETERDDEVSILTTAYLSPANLKGDAHRSYRFTVSSNASGSNTYQFNPGNGSAIKTIYGASSANFHQTYTNTGIKTYTTGGRVIDNYGPSLWFNGKAQITNRS
ncbi:hypothetical protein [Shouchella miscanthi]|uniref:Uncharacterized protein n=1 Tax=Shouchella miscanthi TaxID=2598861 RepID=A0ABU6NSA0_9BACI|nr:hypothetical protein [Shouchella miscanthi]